MVKQKLDKEVRKAIITARKIIEDVAKADGNEAETRRRVERIFESLMGYDVLKHISREHAVHGVGDTEHCDFAIQLDNKESTVPLIMVELKRVNIDLVSKHLKQVTSYAINMGCEWSLLTNGKEWKLYHITYGQPPQTKLVESWNLITDEPAILANKFALIGYKNIKRNGLALLWEKRNVLTAKNVLKIILSEQSLSSIRREIKRATDVAVTPEEIVGAIRHMLNESALGEMENVKISLPAKKQRKTVSLKKNTNQEEIKQESS
jgi:predicted type IV restriction endonuclease